MSILPNQTNINNDRYFFLLVDAKVINTSTINANTGLYDKLFVNTISTGSILVNNISTPTASISSINTNNISSATGYISSFSSDSINVSSLNGQTGFISSLFSDNIRVSSITGQTGFISSLFSDNATISTLTNQTQFTSSIFTNYISSGVADIQRLNISSINNSSIGAFEASNWWQYKAGGTVSAQLGLFSVPQYDILDFRNINCRTLTTTQNVECGNTINALVGNINALNCPDILMSPGSKVARLDCYGTNLVAGDNALFVEGGTTLTGGGIIHGVTIGALRDPSITNLDLVRIDVLPAGMLLTSATFITVTATGATAVTAGGALSLAGGSYIEYNSDQHYFINTSAGNDFTDIYVGNIFPAFNGTANLRINGGGQGSRGVELSNIKSLYLQDGQSSFIRGSPSTLMTVGAISTTAISTNTLVANSISTFSFTTETFNTFSTLTSTINFTSAKGELIELQSPDLATGILFYRNIDGVQEADTLITTNNVSGFGINSFSTIAIQAQNEIILNSSKLIGFNGTNGVFVDGAGLIVNSNATISSINTTQLTADTIYSFSTFTSSINFFNATGQGLDLQFPEPDQGAGLGFYRNIFGVQEFDTGISINNTTGFAIQSISTIAITANDDFVISSGELLVVNANSNIIINAPETEIVNNATIGSISTISISTGSIFGETFTAGSVFTQNIGNFNLIPTPVFFNNAIDLQGNNIINGARIQTGDLDALNISTNNLSTGSLLVNNIVNNSISTNRISTGALFAGTVSTLQVNTSSINTNRAGIDRLTGGPLSQFNTFTNNLFPNTASATVGFGPTTAGGGFYNAGYFRSTFTSVIQPDAVAGQLSNVVRVNGNLSTNLLTTQFLRGAGQFGNLVYTTTLLPDGVSGIGNTGNNFYSQGCFASTFTSVIQPRTDAGVSVANSNVVRINGFVSTQNVFVSTINRKLYPYTSTLNIPFSSFSITGNQAGTPILLYSNVEFLNQGFHCISQKAILSKNTGGSSADIHANIFYTVGAFPSTPSITDGYSALPFVNQDNASTFTTLMTEFYVSTPTTRNILYYDSTANNYTARLYLGTLFDTYTPQTGINPERIPANIL